MEAAAEAVDGEGAGARDLLRHPVRFGGPRRPADPGAGGRADAAGGRRGDRGRFHEATTSDELRDVYEDIGTSVGYRTERQDVSARFIGLGLVLAMGAAAGSLRWFSRLP